MSTFANSLFSLLTSVILVGISIIFLKNEKRLIGLEYQQIAKDLGNIPFWGWLIRFGALLIKPFQKIEYTQSGLRNTAIAGLIFGVIFAILGIIGILISVRF